MNPQFRQVQHWMDAQHRTHRFAPVTILPAVESVDVLSQIERSLDLLSSDMRIRRSSGFWRADSPPTKMSPPAELLHSLSLLHANVLAAYLSLGLSPCAAGGLFELTNADLPTGAQPVKHPPDFVKVVNTFFPCK